MAGTEVLERLIWRTGTVTRVQRETPRVTSLALAIPGWPGHLAGQHIDIRLTAEDGYQAVRSYSMASPPEDPTVTVTVEALADGEVSPYLVEDVRVGDPLEVRGPIGGYFTWSTADGGPLFLVAGGSGVVPLMAMVRHRLAAGSEVPVRLLYSARTIEDVIYRAELDAIGAEHRDIMVVYSLTRRRPEAWTGYDRRIDRQILTDVAWSRERDPLIYVCGPTGFVEAVSGDLVALGYDPDRVKTERFGATGG